MTFSSSPNLGKNNNNLNFTMTFTVPAGTPNFTVSSNFTSSGSQQPGASSPNPRTLLVTVTPTANVTTTLVGTTSVGQGGVA